MAEFNNSRGIIGIFILLIGLLVAVSGIIGGAYYIKTNYLNPSLKSNFSDMPENTSEASNSADLVNSKNSKANQLKSKQTASPSAEQVKSLPGKIYFFSWAQGEIKDLKTTYPNSPNSEKIKPFTSLLKHNENFQSLGVSPDRSLVILKTRFTADNYPLDDNSGQYYYLLSKTGDIKKLDYHKIVTPLLNGKTYGTYGIKGFSTDGKKLVGIIYFWVESESLIFDYDIATEKVTEIARPQLDFKNNLFDIYFYDSVKKLLAYRTFKPKDQQDAVNIMSNTMGKLVNLNDKTEIDFEDPYYNLQPQTQLNLTDFISGNPYFITTNKNPEFVPSGEKIGNIGYSLYKDRHAFSINSFYNPTVKGIEVKLDAPDLTYGKSVLWSSDFNYFAIEVHSNSSASENNQLYIYTRLGKFVAKTEIDSDTFLGLGYFSPDNRYLAINNFVGSWKIFDLQKQTYIQPNLSPAGTVLFWEP